MRGVNKTDVLTLGAAFKTVTSIMKASMEELAACPGLGPTKVKRLHETFHEPFRKVVRQQRLTFAPSQAQTQAHSQAQTRTQQQSQSRPQAPVDSSSKKATAQQVSEVANASMEDAEAAAAEPLQDSVLDTAFDDVDADGDFELDL